LLLCTITTYG
nr:immunoglobulin heavy chain junction region [Mus musculus]